MCIRDRSEEYGRIPWNVRAIWHEYTGWFDTARGTTELYGVPRSAVNADLVSLAGGAVQLANRARAHVEGGKPLEALHLLDIALSAEPDNIDSLRVKKTALDHLLIGSNGSNLSETMWLKSEIAAIDSMIGEKAPQ